MDSEKVSRDEQNWAKPVDTLAASNVPHGALDTVGGKRVLSPIQGFGKMWQKTYRVSLADTGVTPREAIAVWKEEFPAFWPKGSQFYAPLTGHLARGGRAAPGLARRRAEALDRRFSSSTQTRSRSRS